MALLDGSAGSLPARIGARSLSLAQGGLAAMAFSLLLAGTNSTTPLLPVYNTELGFSPLELTLTFSVYVGALIVTLVWAARPGPAGRAPQMLCAALVLAMAGDLLLSTGTTWGILAGRVLAGISGGCGTGASAALVTAVLGDRGRGLSATGNLAGAIIGTIGSQMMLWSFGDAAVHLTFRLHALICLVLLVPLALVLWARRSQNARDVRPSGEAGGVTAVLGRHILRLVTGCVAWIALSSSIVLSPTLFAHAGQPLAQALAVPVMLVFSFAGQVGSPWLAVRLPRSHGMLAGAVGLALVILAARTGLGLLVVPGAALLGYMGGMSYRLSLVLITHGTSPARQGRLASLYAAITYALAAGSVLVIGLLAQHYDYSTLAEAHFAILAVLMLLLWPVAPRLGQSLRP
ncbi:MFS transporter [Pseudooceanicola sp. CBS1P-1]|uniref:MFS transporter n=1 Tax=Pseudooceanicola albus TaxID=2692189 RepID=A0A6L7G561_9RHOB|nr:MULTISPECIES: MFS transporter [Pseudooceanicola]MBT9386078.1 MFS transporter [Pseudooceanicola endophyticus]MXN19504.1 MFS transporter [Pseudooceanicola albus]